MINSFRIRLKKDLKKNYQIYIIAIPMVVFFVLFRYVPMYGITIGFKEFEPSLGILNSPWVGLDNFKEFFNDFYFIRILRNTFLINFYGILIGFPAPIIFALLLNELRGKYYKRVVQTISYLPHFISLVVICGIIKDFTSTDGLINALLSYFGVEPTNMLTNPKLFRTIYISSGIWQGIGWGSIIYLAALSGINSELYEAASIDGAGRLRQTLHVTLPGIAPTIIIMLILRIGSMMSVGHEKIILLYNPLTYETADVISSYVYRKGLQEFCYSYSTAVGLFNSLINFVLLVFANKLSRKVSDTSLW